MGEAVDARRPWLALAALTLLSLVVLSWLSWPSSEGDRTDGEPIAEAPPPPASRGPAPPVEATEPAGGDGPPIAPHREIDALLADALGELHVECFVGEELSGLALVQKGWFSRVTTEREGRHRLKDSAGDVQRVVYWRAPEGAQSVRCEAEAPRWAHLEVTVLEATGEVGAGVGIDGCGSFVETGVDGVAKLQVAADEGPCTLEVFRYDATANVFSVAFHRVRSLSEHERHEVVVQLTDLDLPADGYLPTFDYEHDDPVAPGTTWVRDIHVPLSADEELEQRGEAIEGAHLRLELLRAIAPDVSEQARPELAERVQRERALILGWEERRAELEAQ